MKPPHERALRPDTTLDSPATRGKLPSPERGGQTKNLSVHPSTKTGQLQLAHIECHLTSLRFYCASNMPTASEARDPDDAVTLQRFLRPRFPHPAQLV